MPLTDASPPPRATALTAAADSSRPAAGVDAKGASHSAGGQYRRRDSRSYNSLRGKGVNGIDENQCQHAPMLNRQPAMAERTEVMAQACLRTTDKTASLAVLHSCECAPMRDGMDVQKPQGTHATAQAHAGVLGHSGLIEVVEGGGVLPEQSSRSGGQFARLGRVGGVSAPWVHVRSEHQRVERRRHRAVAADAELRGAPLAVELVVAGGQQPPAVDSGAWET
jgi:hypothetical protein